MGRIPRAIYTKELREETVKRLTEGCSPLKTSRMLSRITRPSLAFAVLGIVALTDPQIIGGVIMSKCELRALHAPP